MKIRTQALSLSWLLVISTCLLATSVAAQEGVSIEIEEEGEVDESRSTVELEVDVREAIDRDTDVANTALTFNNLSATRAIVVCKAFAGNGSVLGTKAVHIAPNGLRYLRASDIADGADFVGSAHCKSRQRVEGSAVFLAPGALTNLNVRHRFRRLVTMIHFPLVATY